MAGINTHKLLPTKRLWDLFYRPKLFSYHIMFHCCWSKFFFIIYWRKGNLRSSMFPFSNYWNIILNKEKLYEIKKQSNQADILGWITNICKGNNGIFCFCGLLRSPGELEKCSVLSESNLESTKFQIEIYLEVL